MAASMMAKTPKTMFWVVWWASFEVGSLGVSVVVIVLNAC